MEPKVYSYKKYRAEIAELERQLAISQTEGQKCMSREAAAHSELHVLKNQIQGFLDWVYKETDTRCGTIDEAKCAIQKQRHLLFEGCYLPHTPIHNTLKNVVEKAINTLKDERAKCNRLGEERDIEELDKLKIEAKFRGTVQGVAAIMMEMGKSHGL